MKRIKAIPLKIANAKNKVQVAAEVTKTNLVNQFDHWAWAVAHGITETIFNPMY